MRLCVAVFKPVNQFVSLPAAPQSTAFPLKASLCLSAMEASILLSELHFSQVGELTCYMHIFITCRMNAASELCVFTHDEWFEWFPPFLDY